ncbi:MAG: LacI family DNA-binding transcriptional regulator [Paracoccaceae bacterium]
MRDSKPPHPARAFARNRPHPQRATINDVAAAIGVSKGTVSRALNGYSDIAEATRLRISKAAQDLGYSPLPHAQAIRTGRVRALGLVLQIYEHDGHRPFLADFLAGVSQVASDEGWTLTIANAARQEDLAPVLKRLVAERKADGFIVARTMLDDPRVAHLRAADVPFVLYGRTRVEDGCAWFDIESDVAMEAAVARLARFGHERIGFVCGDPAYHYNALRLRGYMAGMHAAGLEIAAELRIQNATTSLQGLDATRALLALPAPPTAIVFATDLAALGAWPAAQEAGLAIGRDLSVIGYDGLPEGAVVQPGLTSFAVDSRAAGEELGMLLIRRCRGESPEDLRRTARAKLVARGSDGPPAQTSKILARRIAAARSPQA